MKRIVFLWIMLVVALPMTTMTTIRGSALEREPLEQYRERRLRLSAELDGVIVLFASPAQDLVEYQQEDNFYYLTGFDEPGAILLLDATGDDSEEILFVQKRDESEERWTGAKLGPGEDAERSTGFTTVDEIGDFPARLKRIAKENDKIYTMTDLADNVREIRKAVPGGKVEDLAPAIALHRQVKSDTELGMLEKAIDITMKAHRAAAGMIAPGTMEYEVEAIIEYEFRRNGAERPGFPSIVGSGPFSTILHYDRNIRRMEAGDLVVTDIGAEYSGYTADITRTYPVNGKFNARQKEIYQIVLDAQKAAMERVKPGATIRGRGDNSIHGAALSYIRSKGYGEYFIHGTSHHIGLEVHDVGPVNRPLEPNMVVTIEPGIYIPAENIGVRIEDDVLVTETGYKLLSDLPKEIEDIEAMMAAPRKQ